MYLQLGWRNIWRNPRRTIVVMTAVIIGVWAMIFLGALLRGISEQMVRNGIATLTGHIQVHHAGFRKAPVIENSIDNTEVVKAALSKILPQDAGWSTRVRVDAIASNARHSRGVTLIGIDPEREAGISFIGQAVTEGAYLKAGNKYGIIVGKALVDKFDTKLGHKLVLMSQDTKGDIASRAFRITGIFRAETEATEKQFVFVNKAVAQEMLKLGNRISEVSILLADYKEAGEVVDGLRGVLSSDSYEVLTWRELLPLVTAVLKMYDWFIYLWFLVIFIAMGFGIVNTILMAVFERIREFGLLKALGMKPWWIVKEVLIESSFLLILGMLAGNALGFLTVFALTDTGIDLSAFSEGLEFAGMSRVIYPFILVKDIVAANLVVLILGLVVSAYPAVKAARFTPVEAMAHT
ncbi:MAG: FtsX-like permease family protein [Thermodesulfobacteriota bacterium]|nr:FtsX-like permease family protein [Thermodesulfobacteriota bacterium]